MRGVIFWCNGELYFVAVDQHGQLYAPILIPAEDPNSPLNQIGIDQLAVVRALLDNDGKIYFIPLCMALVELSKDCEAPESSVERLIEVHLFEKLVQKVTSDAWIDAHQ